MLGFGSGGADPEVAEFGAELKSQLETPADGGGDTPQQRYGHPAQPNPAEIEPGAESAEEPRPNPVVAAVSTAYPREPVSPFPALLSAVPTPAAADDDPTAVQQEAVDLKGPPSSELPAKPGPAAQDAGKSIEPDADIKLKLQPAAPTLALHGETSKDHTPVATKPRPGSIPPSLAEAPLDLRPVQPSDDRTNREAIPGPPKAGQAGKPGQANKTAAEPTLIGVVNSPPKPAQARPAEPVSDPDESEPKQVSQLNEVPNPLEGERRSAESKPAAADPKVQPDTPKQAAPPDSPAGKTPAPPVRSALAAADRPVTELRHEGPSLRSVAVGQPQETKIQADAPALKPALEGAKPPASTAVAARQPNETARTLSPVRLPPTPPARGEQPAQSEPQSVNTTRVTQVESAPLPVAPIRTQLVADSNRPRRQHPPSGVADKIEAKSTLASNVEPEAADQQVPHRYEESPVRPILEPSRKGQDSLLTTTEFVGDEPLARPRLTREPATSRPALTNSQPLGRADLPAPTAIRESNASQPEIIRASQTIEPSQPPRTAEKVVEAAQIQKQIDQTRLNLVIRDDHLGRISLRMIERAGVLETAMRADNPRTAQILNDSLLALLETLSNRGLQTEASSSNGFSENPRDAHSGRRQPRQQRDQSKNGGRQQRPVFRLNLN